MSNDMLPFAEDGLNELFEVQTESAFTEVFEKIKLYNELLKDEPVDSEQINAIMRELDNEWQAVMGQTVIISGVASFLPPDAIGVDGRATQEFYEDENMQFGGVMPVRMESVYLDEDQHIYLLKLMLTREAVDMNGHRVLQQGTAKVDDISSIILPDMLSANTAKKWLEYYHPEYIEDIDVALLNPSNEECEMVMRLKDLVFDMKRYSHDTPERMLRSAQAMNVYTNNLFKFDKEVPYQLSVDGDALSLDDDGNLEAAYVKGSTMAAVDRVIWLSAQDEDGYVVRPYLAVSLLDESKDVQGNAVRVPLQSIVDLKSYRYSYFVGYSENLL
jgi:hypothetical protein